MLWLCSGWAGGPGPEPGHAEPQDERGTGVHTEVEGNAGNLVPVPVPSAYWALGSFSVINGTGTGYRYLRECFNSGLNSGSKFYLLSGILAPSRSI